MAHLWRSDRRGLSDDGIRLIERVGSSGVIRLKARIQHGQCRIESLDCEQAAKLEQRRRVRRGLTAQIDPHEAADGLAVVDSVLDPFVGKAEAVLRDVHTHAQHALQPDQPTSPAALWIVTLDYRDQFAPQRHRLNLCPEAIASSEPLPFRLLVLGKARLHRRSSRPWALRTIVPILLAIGQRSTPTAGN